MSKLDDALPCSCGAESAGNHAPDCPRSCKGDVCATMLELIEQSKDQLLPLTWLTKQIEEL